MVDQVEQYVLTHTVAAIIGGQIIIYPPPDLVFAQIHHLVNKLINQVVGNLAAYSLAPQVAGDTTQVIVHPTASPHL